MIEGIYYYGDLLRWNLGWPNPNVAGAFLVCLIPFVWIVLWILAGLNKRYALPAIAVLIIELVLWFLLCKTYSRGALVASILSGIIFFSLLQISRINRYSQRFAMLTGAVRIIVIGLLLWLTGFIGRIEPEFVSSDASATNRLVLWQGGLKMMAADPAGWGVGNSGENFMQWYQPVEATAKYAGMVNSYLHIGVERGIIFLGAVTAAIVFFMLLGLLTLRRCAKSEKRIFAIVCAGCLAVGIGFLVCNFFSTLWIVKGLWVLPMVAAATIVVLASVVFAKKPIKVIPLTAIASVAFACLAMAVLYGVGKRLNDAIFVVREDDRITLFNAPSAVTETKTIIAFPDPEILGPDYGKELRVLLQALEPKCWKMIVPTSEMDESEEIFEVGLFFGDAIANADPALIGKINTVFIIHPTAPLQTDQLVGRKVVLVVPEFDFFGKSIPWKQLAEQYRWPVLVSEGAALDILPVWPEVILQQIHQ